MCPYHLPVFVFLIQAGVKDVRKHSRQAAVLSVPRCISEVSCHIKKTERPLLQQEVHKMVKVLSEYLPGYIICSFYSCDSTQQCLKYGLRFPNY